MILDRHSRCYHFGVLALLWLLQTSQLHNCALPVMKPWESAFGRRPGRSFLVLWANLMAMHIVFGGGSFCLGRYSAIHKASSAPGQPPRCSLVRRCEEKHSQGSGLDPKLLTARISKAKSAARLLKLIGQEVDSKVFDHIHLAAAFSRLAKLGQTHQLMMTDVGNLAWARMVARLCSMLREDELSARSAASVLGTWQVVRDSQGVEACSTRDSKCFECNRSAHC